MTNQSTSTPGSAMNYPELIKNSTVAMILGDYLPLRAGDLVIFKMPGLAPENQDRIGYWYNDTGSFVLFSEDVEILGEL
jgi:hypothetical protein